MTWIPDPIAAKFGGMSSCVHKRDDGTYICLVYDLGPNVCAAGDGATSDEAMANTKRVRWGYMLRADFLPSIPEHRKHPIYTWLHTLSSEQKEMICDLMAAHANNP